MAHVELPENAGDFGLLSRRVVELLRNSPERHRYWRGLRSWVGFQQTGVRVQRDARYAGRSKYNLRKLIGLALDGILSFSVFPLRAAAASGVVRRHGRHDVCRLCRGGQAVVEPFAARLHLAAGRDGLSVWGPTRLSRV